VSATLNLCNYSDENIEMLVTSSLQDRTLSICLKIIGNKDAEIVLYDKCGTLLSEVRIREGSKCISTTLPLTNTIMLEVKYVESGVVDKYKIVVTNNGVKVSKIARYCKGNTARKMEKQCFEKQILIEKVFREVASDVINDVLKEVCRCERFRNAQENKGA